MKKAIAIIIMLLGLACLTGCSSSREYGNKFDVSFSTVNPYSNIDVTDYYKSMKYVFKSKDEITFEYTFGTKPNDPEQYTMSYTAAVIGDYSEYKDQLDENTNERYTKYSYTINAIPKDEDKAYRLSVTEYVYSNNNKSYVKIKQTQWKSDPVKVLVEDTHLYFRLYK